MTKKFLIGFTVLFSIFLFIFIPNVKAEEWATLNDLKDFKDYSYTDEGIENWIKNDVYRYGSSEYNKFIITYIKLIGTYTNYKIPVAWAFNDSDVENGNVYFEKIYDFSSIDYPLVIYNNSENNIQRYTRVNNMDFSNISFNSYLYPGQSMKAFGDSGNRIRVEDIYILTNFDLKDSDGNVIFKANYSSEPLNYEFNEDINSLKYSKVEFKFDIPNNMEKELNINYDFHLITDDNTLDNSHTFKNPYFSERFTSCTVDENGAGSCSPFEKLNQFVIVESEKSCDLNSFNSGGCYGIFDYSKLEDNTINVSNLYKINNYNFIFNADILNRITNSFVLTLDLTFNTDVIVNSYLKSSLPFEVIYYERDFSGGSSSIDYYSTIDMTGKYGALFAPKLDTSKDDLTIRTLFKGEGHLDIQHRSSYNNVGYDILSSYSLNYCNEYLSNQSKIPYSCNIINGEFEFYLSNGNLEQALFFVNADYENDLNAEVYITYDTRYYEYYIFATPTDIVAVVNPNTDEKYYISLEEFYNYVDVDAGFIESIVGKFVDWFYERIPAVNQFKQIISLFTYNEYYNEEPTFEVSLSAIGIEQTVQIVDFSVFDEYRSTVIFWEMLVITTYTVIKVIDNVVSAFKGGK